MKKTTPVVTYYTEGPVAQDLGAAALIEAGARGARLSFSFGTPELQRERAIKVKQAAAKLGVEVSVLADLEGDKPRLGMFKTVDDAESFTVAKGERVKVVYAKELTEKVGTPRVVPIGDQWFFDGLEVGTVLVIADANSLIKMVEKCDGFFWGEVVGAGNVQVRRGINVQGSMLTPACLTEKDKEALAKIAQWPEFDEVAVSFVSKASDIEEAREIMRKNGTVKKVCSKVETFSGVTNIAEVAKATDSVMIARGDLALTLPWTEMPDAVEKIAAACNEAGTPWFLATQIAEGLEMFNMMTRAEMCDLARWLDFGADGLVLSRETAFGGKPLETLRLVNEMVAARRA